MSHRPERRRNRRQPEHPLVVEGHEDTRALYALALASYGFEIDTVDDAACAYARAWETHPDIITTEVSFATCDGWHFIQCLKREPRTRDIPVVVVTSQGQAAVRQRAEREGCSAFLLKPCPLDDLAMTLRNVLNGPSMACTAR